MADTFVTTSISGAQFSDGSVLSGTWTAEYDSSGNLVAVSNATFTVSGSGGTTTFTSMGTLPYATSATGSSYEIHSLHSSGGQYSGLYIDWKTENPSSLYEGTPSLYTSVLNGADSSPATPLRLVSDGSTGQGSTPIISGLPSTETGTDHAASMPFAAVTVSDSDMTTSVSATITLSSNGVPTDADGSLSGTGLSKTSGQVGTYTLTATTPGNLTAELDALKFTPTIGQVAAGHTVSTLIDLAINDSDGSVSADTALTVTATCFLRGTMIATPCGEMAVERLRAGDPVSVIENGIHVSRPVTWVGGRSMDAAEFGGRTAAYPVRIRKDAFAGNVPHRDLLVTPEHCILTEAGLVPARMLVNGGSIVVDRSIPVYDFFHVELEVHGILLAEGLAAESYLDTGNRDLFVDGHAGVSVRDDLPMAAPLAVARDLGEPSWTRLADRARLLGFPCGDDAPAVTDQPNLRLLLEDGRELAACWHDAQRHMFHIPRDVRPVGLLSRAAIPAEIVGPFVDDRRTLGVAVDKLVLWNGLQDVVVPTGGPGLRGWHAAEGTHRWTDGQAELDLPEAGPEAFLDVHLAATGLYRDAVA